MGRPWMQMSRGQGWDVKKWGELEMQIRMGGPGCK